MTEDEIVAHLARSWLGRSDRKRLERELAGMRASRPAQAVTQPRSAPTPRNGGGERASIPPGAVEITKRANGHFYATCSIVAGKTFDALWDTGATDCHLSDEVVRNHLGIRNPKRELKHDHYTTLGDERTRLACATRSIDWMIGGLLVPDVKTAITLDGKGGGNIVGMSLMDKVRWVPRGDRLVIAPPR